MRIDFLFGVAKVYDVKKVDVLKGQTFDVLTDGSDKMRWFSDNDPALSLSVRGNAATMQADNVGKSTILLTNDVNNSVLDEITINVVDTLEQANNLNISGKAIPK